MSRAICTRCSAPSPRSSGSGRTKGSPRRPGGAGWPPYGSSPRWPGPGCRRPAPRGGAAAARRPAALAAPRPTRHLPPLRRRQRLLPAGARPVPGLFVCRLGRQDRLPGGGAGRQAGSDLPKARPARGPAAAGRGLRLGLARPARRPALRGARHRHHPVRGAGGAGPPADRRGGAGGARRDPGAGLPGDRGRAVRRDLLGRDGRARGRGPLPRVRRPVVRSAAPRRAAAEPSDRAPPRARRGAGREGVPRGRLHRRLRLPGRRAGPGGPHRVAAGGGRIRGAGRGGAARALRPDAARVGAQSGGTPDRGGQADHPGTGPGVAPLHGRLGAGVRTGAHRCESDSRRPDDPQGSSGLPLRTRDWITPI